MNGKQQALETMASLKSDSLYEMDEDVLAGAVTNKLRTHEFEGLIIRGPDDVNLATRDHVPLLFVAKQSFSRSQEVALADNAVILAVDSGSGEVWFGPAIDQFEEKIPMPSEGSMSIADQVRAEADEDELPLSMTLVERIDLNALTGLPVEPGRIAMTMISFDWASNTVLSELTEPGVQTESRLSIDDAMSIMESLPSGDDADNQLPGYRRAEYSPTLGAPGVALRVAERYEAGSGVPVYGAVQVRLHPEWVLEEVGDDVGEVALDLLPDAVIPAAVVITRKDVLEPIVIDVRIPIFDPAGPDIGQNVTGFFSLDLATKTELAAGHYMAYLFSDRFAGGPYPINVEKSE